MAGLKVLGLFALLLVAWPASSSARGLLANPEAELGSASSCNTCLFALRLVDDVLADPEVVTSVVNLVDTKVCPRLGPKCHNLAEGLIPVIIQWAKAPATAYQFCRATGSCRASDKPAELAAQRSLRLRDDSAQCITCRMVVGQAQKVLNDTTVLDRLNVTLQQACQMLPAEIAGTCLEMVSTYEPMLVALIEHASPKDICELLAMCEHDLLSSLLLGGSVLHHQQQRVLRGSVPAQLSTSQARRGAAGHSMVLQPGSRQPQLLGAAEQLDLPLGDSCDMCKMAVIEMHSLVGNPSVQAQLINYTKNICDAYPSFADTCKLYVDTYAPVVFSIMEQYLVPDTLCVQIGVCHPPPAAAGMMMPLQASQQHMPCHHGIGGMLRQVVSRAVSYMRMGLGFKVQADQVVMQHTMIMGGMMQPEQEDEQPQGAAA